MTAAESDRERSVELGYEVRDTNVPALLVSGAVLVALIGIALLGSAVLVQFVATRWPEAMRYARTSASRIVAPPKPDLQIDPQGDLQAKRAAEDAVLHSYAWIDRGRGIVRIPIERAMDLVAARGLGATGTPPSPAPGPPSSQGVSR